MTELSTKHLADLVGSINDWAQELGFNGMGIADSGLEDAGDRLNAWLTKGWHGEMSFMSRNTEKRITPELLIPEVKRIISVRLNYWPEQCIDPNELLKQQDQAYIARYALGRDYHRLMRRRLQQLADRISDEIGPFHYRAFVDSAPVMEKPLASAAGLGWIGKHTNLIDPHSGSWFFLGELYTDLPLPTTRPAKDHCGSCTRCLDACPTGALDTAYQLDARQCIAYLTIEHKSSIPEPLRPLMGNRIFGCDDCQLVCPHNRLAPKGNAAFSVRHGLDTATLLDLFAWSPEEFDRCTAGSPIRRLGYERWIRNLSVAIGNSTPSEKKILMLQSKLSKISTMVDEHIEWAINRLRSRLAGEHEMTDQESG